MKSIMITEVSEITPEIIRICKQSENPQIRKFVHYNETLKFYGAELVYLCFNLNGRVVSFACFAVCKNHLTLYAIATLKQFRSQHIAISLFNHMVNYAKKHKKQMIKWKATDESKGFYDKLDIQPKSVEKDQYVYEYHLQPSLLKIYEGA